MNGERLVLALRDIRGHLAQPVVLGALGATVAVLTISGPFRTLDILKPAERLAYWGLVVFGTYGLGTALGVALAAPLHRFGPWLRVAAALPVYGLLIGTYLVLLQGLVFGDWPAAGSGVLTEFGTATLVSGLLLGLDALAQGRRRAPGPSAPDGDGASPAILRRLPSAQRGPLLALSAEDHYVRVRTGSGEALVLMRLSDAMAETAPVPGLQVHRSHWVALAAVQAAQRLGDGATLRLTNGSSIPVSRRYLPDLRQAGLLMDRAVQA